MAAILSQPQCVDGWLLTICYMVKCAELGPSTHELCQIWGPCPKRFSIVIQIRWKFLFCLNPNCSGVIAMKFCTWHDSCTVMARAKFCSDMVPCNEVTLHEVLLQWKSTSVYTSSTYSIYHLELALGTVMPHFVSACLVCHTSWEKNRIQKFTVPDSRGVSISPLWRPLCRGCKQIAHVLGNDCDIVFISLKSTEKVQQVTLSCSCCFTDPITEVWVAVKR